MNLGGGKQEKTTLSCSKHPQKGKKITHPMPFEGKDRQRVYYKITQHDQNLAKSPREIPEVDFLK